MYVRDRTRSASAARLQHTYPGGNVPRVVAIPGHYASPTGEANVAPRGGAANAGCAAVVAGGNDTPGRRVPRLRAPVPVLRA